MDITILGRILKQIRQYIFEQKISVVMTMRSLHFPRIFCCIGRRRRLFAEPIFTDSISSQLSSIQNELVQLCDPFIKPFTGDGTRRLYVPVGTRAEFFEAQK